MSAALTIAGVPFADAPSLARAVLDDAREGGGAVVAGQRPAVWLAVAVRAGELSRAQAIGLSAALVQSGDAAAILEVAELAVDLDLTELAPLLRAAHDALDLGVLLRADPRSSEGSVEDALLSCWAALASSSDPANLRELLIKLRNAGLRPVELQVLLTHSTPALLAEWLPLFLAEPASAQEIEQILAVRQRSDQVAQVVEAALASAGLAP